MFTSLADSRCEYIRASALAWSSLTSATPRMIDDHVAKRLAQLAAKESQSTLVIDCRGSLMIADHAFDVSIGGFGTVRTSLETIRNGRRSVIFRLDPKAPGLDHELQRALGKARSQYDLGDDLVMCYGPEPVSDESAAAALRSVEATLKTRTGEWIAACFQP